MKIYNITLKRNWEKWHFAHQSKGNSWIRSDDSNRIMIGLWSDSGFSNWQIDFYYEFSLFNRFYKPNFNGNIKKLKKEINTFLVKMDKLAVII